MRNKQNAIKNFKVKKQYPGHVIRPVVIKIPPIYLMSSTPLIPDNYDCYLS